MKADAMTEMTIFDKILEREIPASIVYEDDYVLAFKDIHPQASVHVVVIPKKRAKDFAEVAAQWLPTEVGAFWRSIGAVAQSLGLQKDGFRVVFNNGMNAGQTVAYIHAHILAGEPLGGFGAS